MVGAASPWVRALPDNPNIPLLGHCYPLSAAALSFLAMVARASYQVLQATGVFKQDESGQAGWDRFLRTLLGGVRGNA